MPLRHDAAVTPVNRRNAAFQIRHVALDVLQFVAHQRAAVVGAHRHQPHLAVGEVEHLQGFGVLDQAPQGVGHFLFGADDVIDAEMLGQKAGFQPEEITGADARDAGGHIEQGGRDAARHQVGFVALRDRDQHVGVLGAGLLQDRGVRGMAAHGAQIEAVLQQRQPGGVEVDDGDVVVFRDQAFGQVGTDLAGAEDDDFHMRGAGSGKRRGGEPSPCLPPDAA